MALVLAKTKYGVVRGDPEVNSVSTVFKGVPYAKPPVGELRFSAPREPESWTGERACTTWAPVCTQEKRKWPPEENDTVEWIGSEDCLYLNVWTPADTPEDKLPVLFWIYGGGFYGGSSHDPLFDGTAYNKRGVLLVTVGFRSGALGFLGLPELEDRDEHHSSGNYGFLDIIAALRWVRENISAFGGDPGNVTIFGQSSGAMTVKMLLGCEPARGLFHHAISMSGGGTWDIDPVRPAEEKYVHTRQLLDWAGWTLTDLLTKDAEEICSTLEALVPKLGLKRQSLASKLFQPSIDGYIVKGYYGEILYNGGGQDIDIMCGTIREEWHNFPHQIPGGIAGYEREFALAPGIAWGKRYIQLGKKPVYHYFFDHDLPGENPSPGHSSDMPYTFGVLEKAPRPWTAYDYEMSEIAVDYWTSFARTGNPNTRGRPEWPAFTEDNPVTLRFANGTVQAERLCDDIKVDKVVRFLLDHPGILSDRFLD